MSRMLLSAFSIRAFGTDVWLCHDPEPVAVNALPNLNFLSGIVAPMKGTKFPTDRLLEHSIGVVDPATEAEVLPAEQVIPVGVKYDPKTGRRT